jgi:hypothetical protein
MIRSNWINIYHKPTLLKISFQSRTTWVAGVTLSKSQIPLLRKMITACRRYILQRKKTIGTNTTNS